MSKWRRRQSEPPWLRDFKQDLEFRLGEMTEDFKVYVGRQMRQEANYIIAALKPPNNNPATQLRILIGGIPVANSITLNVDVQNQVMSAQFADDKGEPTTDVPPGAVLAYSTSDATVIGVDAVSGVLTFNHAGEVDLGGAANDATGAPVMGPDGTTPITGTEHVSVTAGPASQLLVSVGGAAPVPVPAP